ncbi:hypothetical protein HHE02_09650 [Helicobacter heilmannii]|uniref:Uncharacterized protein n=1 Tax=Helicobacter heilmannii TaxID=35817 RepID=A0A0K2XK25_HELHE|nr:hypothetical protein BN341_1160 [Helicobacter heilmannii ASB1.4]CRF46006.1 hypothetical protein HHE014_09910 [Helicobacter heilmannii]CRF47671.1 hypothetical protein HHE02_09650 [Helicobacter heilmannii]CRF49714.1 hypothetical protein HHE03_13770 [Helicobacter heilmannii]CRF50380.1 hypothetical protein HHE06_02050 [Helicobacter heilmannii]
MYFLSALAWLSCAFQIGKSGANTLEFGVVKCVGDKKWLGVGRAWIRVNGSCVGCASCCWMKQNQRVL